MAESNSYTFAFVIIAGLVALFFIYWFSTSRRPAVVMNENYENMQEDDVILLKNQIIRMNDLIQESRKSIRSEI